MAKPDDVVGASLYLLSDASIYVSGTDLKLMVGGAQFNILLND